jgi:arylsulfatase
VPLLVRWPGRIAAGSIANGIVQHHDWLPTFLAMAGAPDVVEKLKKGYKAIGRTYKNHIDGYNLLPYLTGKEKASPRNFFFYFSDDGDMLGLRFDNWKIVFMEQRLEGTLGVWAEPFVRLRLPKLYNLRTDPFEYASITSNTYWDWMINRGIIALSATAIASKFAETFKEFPPVQRPNTFTVDDALEKMSDAVSGAGH